MIIHGDLKSGNCLKVKWTADLLGIPYTWRPIDIMQGESRTPAYLTLFPQGQVPAIELAASPGQERRTLAQSNAIIRYFARGTRLLPDDAYTQAKIDEWLFWEQYSHEPNIATCRFHMVYLGKSKETRNPDKVTRGEKALDYMERMLEHFPTKWLPGSSRKMRPDKDSRALFDSEGSKNALVDGAFLVGDTPTIADIALLAYTRVAQEGGFDLTSRPHLRKWIATCEQRFKLN